MTIQGPSQSKSIKRSAFKERATKYLYYYKCTPHMWAVDDTHI